MGRERCLVFADFQSRNSEGRRAGLFGNFPGGVVQHLHAFGQCRTIGRFHANGRPFIHVTGFRSAFTRWLSKGRRCCEECEYCSGDKNRNFHRTINITICTRLPELRVSSIELRRICQNGAAFFSGLLLSAR